MKTKEEIIAKFNELKEQMQLKHSFENGIRIINDMNVLSWVLEDHQKIPKIKDERPFILEYYHNFGYHGGNYGTLYPFDDEWGLNLHKKELKDHGFDYKLYRGQLIEEWKDDEDE